MVFAAATESYVSVKVSLPKAGQSYMHCLAFLFCAVSAAFYERGGRNESYSWWYVVRMRRASDVYREVRSSPCPSPRDQFTREDCPRYPPKKFASLSGTYAPRGR